MKSLGQLLLGLLAAVISVTLVVSAVSLSLLEGRSAEVAVVTVEPTAAPTLTPAPAGATRTAAPTLPGVTPTPTLTAPPTEMQPTACPAPRGWKPYEVQPGDTLRELAAQAGTSAAKVREANCLTVSSLMPGTILYLPLKPTATVNVPSTPTPLPTVAATVLLPTTCAPPPTWSRYVVRPGDTLFRIGLSVGLTTDALRSANCLTTDRIYVGQILYLPFIPARTATPIPSPTPTNTRVVPTAVVRTRTPTRQPTATFTATSTVSRTPTRQPTATFTATATFTFTPTATFTFTPSPTHTATFTPVPTSTVEAYPGDAGEAAGSGARKPGIPSTP